jgi:threonine dehydrogenase-like Zn-dependent dehydrogenase
VLAGRILSRGRIELVEAPEPTLGKPSRGPEGAGGEIGEIIVQPEIACLCGSDLPYFDEPQPSYPLEPGMSLHEIAGTVLETNGSKFRPGDLVLAVPVGQQGLFQRFRLSEERAVPLDRGRPLEMSVLAQPLGTVIHALKKIPPVLDLDVAVVGQGPIGQMFCAVLRNLGACEIIAIDPLESRLSRSPRLGATAVVNPAREDCAAAVARITRGRMVDLVIEAVGHENQALDLCVGLIRKGGRILYFGVPQETLSKVRWLDLFLKNATVHTSVNPDFTRDFPLAVRWLYEGRVDLSPLVTHRFPLSEIQKAYETFRDRVEGALKVMIEFPDPPRP